MARTAPVPNIPAIPGMNPGLFVMGGGGDGGGSGAGGGKGGKGKQGADGKNGGKDAEGGGKGACGQGAGADGGACPNNHGGPNGATGGQSQGDPVDVVTGEVFTPPTLDVDLPGPLPLEIARSYRTGAAERDVGLGWGWTHGLSWRAERRRRSTIVHTLDGLEVDFGRIAPDAANLGPHGWLLHRDGDALVLDLPDARSLRFDPDPTDPAAQLHRLTAITDRSGNRITLEYEGALLARVTDSAGRVLVVRRTAAGQIAAWETAVRGEPFVFARFRYDTAGCLVEAQDAEGFATTFAYDDAHRMIEKRHPTGLTFHYRYDAAGRCVETWGEYGESTDPCLADDLPATLADGKTRAKGVHHVALEYGPDGYTEAVDAVTIHRSWGNALGKVDKAVCAGAVYTRRYDARGHMIEFVDPTGAVTRWERDLWGNETKVVDPLGHVTVLERDAAGDLLRVVDPEGGVTTVDRGPRHLRWSDPTGAVFEVRYDARGLVEEVVAPSGHRRRYVHDAQGNLIEAHGALGGVTTATYDELGRRRSITTPDGATTRLHRDRRGLLVAVERAGGGVTRYGWDADGRLTSITEADGALTRIVRGGTGVAADVHLPDGTCVRFRHDRMERLVAVHNGKGETHTLEWSALGVVTRERTFDGREIRHAYDEAGRLIQTTGDAESVELVRDALGRVVQKTYDDGTEETFAYNGRSELIHAAGPHAEVTFERDAAGRITRERQSAFGREYIVMTEYDALGRARRKATSDGHALEWAYDDATRRLTTRLDGSEAVLSFQDVMGAEVRTVLPGGASIDARYDLEGRMVARSVVRAGGSARAGAPEPAWVGASPAGAEVDQRYTFGSSGALATAWDARFGLVELRHDAAGQLAAVVPRQAAGLVPELAARGPGPREFGYDAAGNLVETTLGAEPRAYGPGGRLLRQGGTELVWDERGCLSERRERGAGGEERVTRFHFGATGRLDAIDLPDGRRVEHAYDPFARRVRKIVLDASPGRRRVLAATHYFWDGMTLAAEVHAEEPGAGGAARSRERFYCFDGTGAPRAHRTRRAEGGEVTEEPWRFYLNDPLTGYPERLLDGGGAVVSEMRHDPWGRLVKGAGEAPTPLRFAGQYEDEETGLFYNRHRFYDPATGRYLSPDPAGLRAGLNTYSYAENQPALLVDVDGLVYSEVTDPGPPPKTYKGWNPSEGGTTTPHPWISDKPCAEAQALTHMANDIQEQIKAEQKKVPMAQRLDEKGIEAETQKRMKEKLNHPDAKIETWDQENAKRRKRVDPCPRCGKMFEKLEITGAVVGAKGKKGEYGVYRR